MLRAALDGMREAGMPMRFLPPPPKTPEIARLLVERYGDGAAPRKSASALQALLRRLRLARYDWDKIDPADRLDVAWVLWEGPVPPAEHEAFLRDFLQWLETPRRRLQAARLAASWAAAFDPDLASIRVAGEWLARHASWLPDPWPRLAAELEIFSVENGPVALAESFLASEQNAGGFFQNLRFPARAVAGGLVLEALGAAAASVERRLARQPRLAARLCAFALHANSSRYDAEAVRAKRRAKAIRRTIAEALLLPWQRQAPPPKVKVGISAFLVRHYGDVRVMPGPWADLRAPAAAIMRRWLTEQTVATYFGLARQTKSANRMRLAEREEFWLSRLDAIDDAWLLSGLGTAAALGADQPAHGSLSGCRPDQVGLLLSVAGMTVLELSHETSESIWFAGNPLAPPLYRRTDQPYWPAALASGADFSSAFSRNGSDDWQKRLANFLDKQSRGMMAA